MHLAEYMESLGLSDEEVAELLEKQGFPITRVTVGRIRRRKVRPSWPTVSALFQLSGGKVTANDFVDL